MVGWLVVSKLPIGREFKQPFFWSSEKKCASAKRSKACGRRAAASIWIEIGARSSSVRSPRSGVKYGLKLEREAAPKRSTSKTFVKQHKQHYQSSSRSILTIRSERSNLISLEKNSGPLAQMSFFSSNHVSTESRFSLTLSFTITKTPTLSIKISY